MRVNMYVYTRRDIWEKSRGLQEVLGSGLNTYVHVLVMGWQETTLLPTMTNRREQGYSAGSTVEAQGASALTVGIPGTGREWRSDKVLTKGPWISVLPLPKMFSKSQYWQPGQPIWPNVILNSVAEPVFLSRSYEAHTISFKTESTPIATESWILNIHRLQCEALLLKVWSLEQRHL